MNHPWWQFGSLTVPSIFKEIKGGKQAAVMESWQSWTSQGYFSSVPRCNLMIPVAKQHGQECQSFESCQSWQSRHPQCKLMEWTFAGELVCPCLANWFRWLDSSMRPEEEFTFKRLSVIWKIKQPLKSVSWGTDRRVVRAHRSIQAENWHLILPFIAWSSGSALPVT